MSAIIDHVGIPATDPEAAGAFLAWVLGEGSVVPDGPPGDDSGDMFSLVLDGWSLAFMRAPQPAPVHLAIRVTPETFTAAVGRLGERGIAFGNDPEDAANGRADDPLGGAGRAYFRDRDGHFYELVVASVPGDRPAVPRAVTLIRSASLSGVAEYAYAATAPAGSRLVFLAGACPLNEDGTTAAPGDYAGQAAKAFENMRTALADAGASVEDVLSTRVLVASARQQDLVAAWEVVRDSFGPHDVPSTLTGVTVLGYKDQLVEIEAVAAVLDS